MPTEVIAVGRPVAVAQSTVYAMPARPGRIHATTALDFSPDGTNGWGTVTATTTGTDVGSGFVRCTISTTCVAIYRPY